MAQIPVVRQEVYLTAIDEAAWYVLVPRLSGTASEKAGFRMRTFIGGHVYNADTVAATFIVRINDASTQTTITRVTLDVQYYRYVFDEADVRNLGTDWQLEIQLAAAETTNKLIAVGRFADS